MARPTVMTPEILERLRHAFAIGATKEEACAYAKIGKSTLYDYINANPEFSEEIEQLIQQPILKAKQTIVNNLDDVKNAQWYAERKSDDLNPKSRTDITSNGETLKGLINIE